MNLFRLRFHIVYETQAMHLVLIIISSQSVPNECDSFPQGCPEDSSCQELSKRKICVCKVGLEMIGNSCKGELFSFMKIK